MINGKADEVSETILESHLTRYQIGFETLMAGISFIFDCVHLLHYKCDKINVKLGGSYTDLLIG